MTVYPYRFFLQGLSGWALIRLAVTIIVLATVLGFFTGCATTPVPRLPPGTSQVEADRQFRRAWPPYFPEFVEMLPDGTIREIHARKDIWGGGSDYVVTYVQDGVIVATHHYGF